MMRLFIATIICLIAAPVMANDDAKSAAKSVTPSPDAKLDSKHLNDMIDALLADAPAPQKNHFMVLYHTHNTLGVVRAVRHDINEAVNACSDKHPDMAKKITTRFQQWTGDVNPILAEAEGQINNMIIVQDYAQPQDIAAILNEANKLRAKGEMALKKVPVTSQDACENFYKTMQKSQKSFSNILRKTVVSVPQLLSKDGMKPLPQSKPETK